MCSALYFGVIVHHIGNRFSFKYLDFRIRFQNFFGVIRHSTTYMTFRVLKFLSRPTVELLFGVHRFYMEYPGSVKSCTYLMYSRVAGETLICAIARDIA
jgi:hypothetical protein